MLKLTHIIFVRLANSRNNFSGSVALGFWKGSSSPVFLMANISFAMFEKNISKLDHISDTKPKTGPSSSLSNFSCFICLRTFGVVLWETFLRDAFEGGSSGGGDSFTNKNDTYEFKLIDEIGIGDEYLQFTGKTNGGLTLHTTTGIECKVENCLIVDCTIYNSGGFPVWGVSKPVVVKKSTAIGRNANSFDIGFSKLGLEDNEFVLDVEEDKNGKGGNSNSVGVSIGISEGRNDSSSKSNGSFGPGFGVIVDDEEDVDAVVSAVKYISIVVGIGKRDEWLRT